MDRHEGSRIRNRGTVLIVSRSGLFSDIVSEMVVDSGFASASPVASEPAWLTLTRTQPCIVICDCDAPADSMQRLIAEASARCIPLMLSERRSEHHIERTLTLAHRVAWLTFPVSYAAFCSMLDALLPSTVHSFHRVAARGPGMSMEAAFSVRALVGASRGGRGYPGRVLAHIGHTDEIDNGRADDDGMPVAAG
ncbi:MAG TPA: hypothetical protein VL383_16730 [Gemmatimonadaceae bacterium]|jgi:DNA-binding response OmpR family regulator|nr:hypothetical protein [Gemmatimonadaceae bacterium]